MRLKPDGGDPDSVHESAAALPQRPKHQETPDTDRAKVSWNGNFSQPM